MKKIFLPIAVPIVIGITAFTITSCGGEEKNELKGE